MATQSTSVKVKKRMTNFMLRTVLNITFYVLLIVLIISVSKASYTMAYQLYGPVAVDKKPGTDILFEINQGESSMTIASKMQQKRLIVNKYSFYLKAKIDRMNIMPGTYPLNTSMTYDEIFKVITDLKNSVKKEDSKKDSKTDPGKK